MNKMPIPTIDFSRLHTILCCFGNERVNDLYAAAFNILMNVENAVVTVAYNTLCLDENAKMRKSLLEALAKNTNNNELVWVEYPEDFSKARMIAETMLLWRRRYYVGSSLDGEWATHRNWMLNVDDDYMVPYKTLRLFELASKANKPDCGTYVYGQFDIVNYRGYEDWDATKLGMDDLFNFIRDNGMRCVPNHLMKSIPDELITFKMPGQSTGAYIMDLNRITPGIAETLTSWPKGKRGYDEFLCNAVGGVHWIFGSNSYHTDRTMAHVDGKVWHTDVFRDDLMMDGSVKGRQPSKIGEASIPRAEKPADAPEIPYSKPNESL